jgi:hypothetical protein
MVPLVHLLLVIHHVSTTRALVSLTRIGAFGLIKKFVEIQAMIVTPAATASTLQVVTHLTVGKDHTRLRELPEYGVNLAQLASTHLQVRRECLLRCLLFSHPIACDIHMCVVSCYISRSLFALVGLFLHEWVSCCIGRSLFTLVGVIVCVCLHTCIRVCTHVPMDSAGQSWAQFIGGLHAR